jgi:hypothetical protein
MAAEDVKRVLKNVLSNPSLCSLIFDPSNLVDPAANSFIPGAVSPTAPQVLVVNWIPSGPGQAPFATAGGFASPLSDVLKLNPASGGTPGLQVFIESATSARFQVTFDPSTTGRGIKSFSQTMALNTQPAGAGLQAVGCAQDRSVFFSVDDGGALQYSGAGSWYKITWPHVVSDTSNALTNDSFKPSVPGRYLVIASVGCMGSGANDECLIWVGPTFPYTAFPAITADPGLRRTGSDIIVPAQGVFQLNGTTDAVEVWVVNGTGVWVGGGPAGTFFQAVLVGP